MVRLKIHLVSFLCVLIFGLAHSQSPPQIIATGNQQFCGDSPMPIVTDISIADGSGSLDVVYIQISQGYTNGQDLLTLNGAYPNISSTWSADEGLLTLTGNATYGTYELAISDVLFTTTQTNFAEDKTFSINLGEANFLPTTNHYYFYVSQPGISWTQAKAAAESQTYFGLQGYLATITTEEEAQLTGQQSAGTGWIAGSDRINEGTWIWESGPEEGEVFWEGLSNGSAPDGVFSFWNSGEPNNLGEEDYAHVTDPSIGILGSWNDLPDTGDANPNSPYHPKGYVVEFGGMPGDPDINISASTIIVTPKLEIEIDTICDEGSTEIVMTSNTDTILWYETPSSTEVINSGLSYETILDSTTTFWLSATFSGCVGGPRIPVTITVFDSPIASNITIVQCDDEVLDGASVFNIANYSDEILEGNTVDSLEFLELSFYRDIDLMIEINELNYQNISNPQTVYVEVYNVLTDCSSISEVTLQVNSGSYISATIETCDDFIVDGFTFFDLSEADNQILNNSPVNASIGYYESYDEALLEVNQLDNEYFNLVAYNQVIYARVNTDVGCYAINEVSLIVKDIPDVIQYEEIYYCFNSYPETITLDGGIVNDVPNNYSYNWSTGETTMTIEINEIGTYTVLVTRPAGCTNRRTIVVQPSGAAVIETIEVTDVSSNNVISVFVTGEGEYVFALDNENGPYQESNIFNNVTPGIHTVFIRDIENNCGTIFDNVSVIGFPKFFTPNGDAKNDTWQIAGFSSQFPVTASVEIFNRYGKLIKVLNQTSPSWDGTYNGELMQTDDYWFVARLIDGRDFKGHFTLKR